MYKKLQTDLGGVRAEVGEARRVAESAGSQASAANETLRSLTARVAALETRGPVGGSVGSGGWAGLAVGSKARDMLCTL